MACGLWRTVARCVWHDQNSDQTAWSAFSVPKPVHARTATDTYSSLGLKVGVETVQYSFLFHGEHELASRWWCGCCAFQSQQHSSRAAGREIMHLAASAMRCVASMPA